MQECPGGEFKPGQQVAALMGGLGRRFDGGYAEYTCVPVSQVVPFTSSLPWSILGAIPEMLQTANGSLTVGLDAKSGQSLLVRGGTSEHAPVLVVPQLRRRPPSSSRVREAQSQRSSPAQVAAIMRIEPF